jgi:1-acyl-sn-glycerol-3-phosphate acyltransferase
MSVKLAEGRQAEERRVEGGLTDRLRRVARLGPVEFLRQYIEEQTQRPVFQRDTEFLEWLLPLMDLFARYFDAEVRNLEKVPAEGAVLLVGNHSGGVLVPDTSALISAWYREFGLSRRLMGLAFDAAFAIPGFERLMRQIGQIPASHENAVETLERGDALLVYPGGAHETFRPWSQRNRIDFSGHKGFVRLALRTGVPVVPVVGHGAHESIVVLARGESVAERIGLTRLRLRVAPLVWQLPWGLSLPLTPGIPLPTKITVQICDALDWSSHGPEGAQRPEVVDRCYDEITTVMQETLTGLAEANPYPLLRRLHGWLPAGGSRSE